MKQERTKDWVRLLPWAVLTMKSQRSSSTGFTPHEPFHGGRPAWFFKTPFPEDFKSPVGDWLEHKQSMANHAWTNLRHILEPGLVPYSTCTVRYRYHTVLRCPVWYRLAPMKTQEAPLNVRIPWCYDIFKLIPTTRPLSQKHQKISTNICHHRPDAAFVLNLFSKCEWASIGGTLLWF